jgi:hypothetical protein
MHGIAHTNWMSPSRAMHGIALRLECLHGAVMDGFVLDGKRRYSDAALLSHVE